MRRFFLLKLLFLIPRKSIWISIEIGTKTNILKTGTKIILKTNQQIIDYREPDSMVQI